MPLLQSNLHVNRPLTDMLIKFDWTQIGWARNLFFPRKPVDKLSNQMRQIARENMLRLVEGKTGEHGKVKRVQFQTGPTQTYLAEIFAYESVLSQTEANNADSELQYMVQQAEQPVISANIRMEYLALKQTLRSTAQLTQNTTLNSNQLWSNFTSGKSDPIADLMAACMKIVSQVQRKANRMLIDHMVWAKMMQHPAVLQRLYFNAQRTGAILTPQILESILEPWLEPGSITIYKARYNVAADGEAEQLASYLANDVIVAYVDQPGMMSWGMGYEFAWNGYYAGGNSGDPGLSAYPMVVLQYPSYEDPFGSNNIRVAAAVNYAVTKPQSAYLIKGVVDSTLADFNGELSY